MAEFHWAWSGAAAGLAIGGIWVGLAARGDWKGILVDSRGRYSLTQFQMVLWTFILIPLIFAVFWARYRAGDPALALEFTIPDELLIVLGISLGSGAVSTTVKAAKDRTNPENIAACDANHKPRFAQLFLLEEGELADEAVDVAKFQNFWITVILATSYLVLAIDAIGGLEDITQLETLPAFGSTFVTLLGISHAGYVAGKIPTRPGTPAGLTLAARQGAVPDPAPAAATVPR